MTLGVSALGEVNLDRSHLAWVAARGRDTGSFGQTGSFEPKLCTQKLGKAVWVSGHSVFPVHLGSPPSSLGSRGSV